MWNSSNSLPAKLYPSPASDPPSSSPNPSALCGSPLGWYGLTGCPKRCPMSSNPSGTALRSSSAPRICCGSFQPTTKPSPRNTGFSRPTRTTIGIASTGTKSDRQHVGETSPIEQMAAYLPEMQSKNLGRHCQSEGGKCDKFHVRLDPHRNRAVEERRLRLVHGLLACKTCGRPWNRDVDSSINIARLTRQAREGDQRLSRQSQPPEPSSDVASTA